MTGSLKLLAPWLLPIELPQPPTHKKKKQYNLSTIHILTINNPKEKMKANC